MLLYSPPLRYDLRHIPEYIILSFFPRRYYMIELNPFEDFDGELVRNLVLVQEVFRALQKRGARLKTPLGS